MTNKNDIKVFISTDKRIKWSGGGNSQPVCLYNWLNPLISFNVFKYGKYLRNLVSYIFINNHPSL